MTEDKLVSDIEWRAQSLFSLFKKMIKEDTPEKWVDTELEFKIIESKEINGKAKVCNNVDHIEINRGVIDRYYSYFSEVMKYDMNQMLKTILSDLSEEKIEACSYEKIDFTNGKVQVIDGKIINEKVASFLEINVSRFIVLHELGHIFSGHCAFLKDSGYSLSYIEMYHNDSETETDEEKALTIRTLEMDADSFAATQSMNQLLYLYFNFETQVHIPDMQPMDVFYWWSFAIRSHFILCEDLFCDQHYFPTMKHLPSLCRWNLVFNVAKEIINNSKLDLVLKDHIIKAFTNGAIDAEIKYNDIKFTNYSWISELNASKEYYYAYVDEVNQHWKKIKVKLEKYSQIYLA